MMTFLPRIFFIDDKEINLVIHRNTSNKFRVFIKEILTQKKIKVKKFIYLDDDFYKFNNSKIPQFFTMAASTIILNKSLSYIKQDSGLKVYLSRQNSVSRNLINEGDLRDTLRFKKNFTIVDTNNMSIFEQIKIFSAADVIIGPTSSALANIVFSKKGTRVIEIIPKYKYDYEKTFKIRYSKICKYIGLKYMSIEADPVNNVKLNSETKKFISKRVLKESNYYKNLLIDVKKFEKVISDF
jgi:capsular polysaccharide biosynthesis protein